MPSYCGPDLELLSENAKQEKNTVKCLSEGHNRMAQVGFKPKLGQTIDSTITRHQAKLFSVLTMRLIAVFIIKHNNDKASTEIL